jgi:leader peptidase (prepilin peptidase) / N-methyltransferase
VSGTARLLPRSMTPEPASLFGKVAARLTRQQIVLRASIGMLAIAAGVASIMVAPGLRGLLGAGLAVGMLAIAVIDARQFIIPNELIAIGLSLGLVHAGIAGSETATEGIALAAIRGVVLALAFLGLRAIYSRLRGRQGIGLGDVKLAGVAGVWLDWQIIPIAVEVATLSALAIYALRQWTLGRSMRWTSRIPLGLFLAPAIWLSWFLDALLFGPL